jgi:hypothetical protein
MARSRLSRRAVMVGAAGVVASELITNPSGPAAAQQLLRRLGDPAPLPPETGQFTRPPADKPLPDGRLVRGNRQILAAWFSDPTQRYRHFALGTEHEAGALVVAMKDRRAFKFTLPADSVFEDREPRIVDVDGVDMVVAVRSYLKHGAALALLAVGKDGLEIVAETPPIGQPFRWLNPAGVADFDGDGVLDLAASCRFGRPGWASWCKPMRPAMSAITWSGRRIRTCRWWLTLTAMGGPTWPFRARIGRTCGF